MMLPFSLLFVLAGALRRFAYAVFSPVQLPVPVVVVGNLTVGGTGKTPVVLWLVERLRAAGYRPGVISRGYGAAAGLPCPVGPDSDPAAVGDEPVLLARRAGCPVWVGRRRVAAAQGLLAECPDVDVIVSDDGLQHYALPREVEIVVVDGRRGFGNRLPLPAGPMRESVRRLNGVDAVVVNGVAHAPGLPASAYVMSLSRPRLYNLNQIENIVGVAYFANRRVHAVAGIGNPARFFDTLESLGIEFIGHAYPDHHVFKPEDLPTGTLIMTEKDAVKCAGLGLEDAWVLAVDADLPEGLERQILNKLENRNG